MNTAVARDLSRSAEIFSVVVWPRIASWFGGGRLIPVESVSDSEHAQLLDMASGIDGWHYHEAEGMRGISSRVQWGDKAWDTFTIRYQRNSGAKTEYAKRLRALNSPGGWLYPFACVQAYVSDESEPTVLSVAAISTAELFEFAERIVADQGTLTTRRRTHGIRRTSNAEFLFMGWDWLIGQGAHVKVLRPGVTA